MKNHIIKKIKLVEDAGRYYLDVTYLVEDDQCVKEVHIPRVDICFNLNTCPKISERYRCLTETPIFNEPIIMRAPEYLITAGATFNIKELNGVAFTEQILEEKTREMTIEEIEKKLGYKIKIVSEDKK